MPYDAYRARRRCCKFRATPFWPKGSIPPLTGDLCTQTGYEPPAGAPVHMDHQFLNMRGLHDRVEHWMNGGRCIGRRRQFCLCGCWYRVWDHFRTMRYHPRFDHLSDARPMPARCFDRKFLSIPNSTISIIATAHGLTLHAQCTYQSLHRTPCPERDAMS